MVGQRVQYFEGRKEWQVREYSIVRGRKERQDRECSIVRSVRNGR